MKTITIEKKKIKTMDDLIKEVDKGFRSISFSIDTLEKRIEAQHGMILDIHTNFVTKTEFRELDTKVNRLDNRVVGLEKGMSKLLKHFGLEEDGNEIRE